MEVSLKALVIASVIGSSFAQNMKRQFPAPLNVHRRVDGISVLGSNNDLEGKNPIEAQFIPTEDTLQPVPHSDIPSLQAADKMEVINEEPGFIDSIFGNGVQSRIISSVNGWVLDKASTNPGCVERFVCETYRAGENLNGFPYLVMSLTNAAVSFMVADMFDQSVNINEITRAARTGRTIGSCHAMKCDFMDGQLRTLGDYYETIGEFFSTFYSSLASSFNLGK